MAKNKNLHKANTAKKNEFYTRYEDIEKEMNAYFDFNKKVFKDKIVLLPCDDPEWSNFTKYFIANFKRFGLKKLISTSYAKGVSNSFTTDFEKKSPVFDEEKHKNHGKVFVFDRTHLSDAPINFDDLSFNYLEGDGDFRSDEVKKFRDEADIIITNPPFSLFREFLTWILEADKKFIIIGNQNAITYKEVFPLIKDNKIWLGNGFNANVGFFKSPYEDKAVASDHKEGLIRVSGVMWFTNIDHGKRHQEMPLMSMADNLKFNKTLLKKLKEEYRTNSYPKYDNYNAIEVPISKAIPIDYNGVMGVPITFLDQYCPNQFEIIALGNSRENFTPTKDYKNPKKHTKEGKIVNGGAINCVLAIEYDTAPNEGIYYTSDNSKYLVPPYARILIKIKKKEKKENENNIKD